MRTHATIARIAMLAAVCTFAGCGADDSADGLARQSIAKMNQVADALEAGKTEDQLKGLKEEMEAIGKKMDALNLSQEEKDALQKKYEPEMKEASSRMVKAMMKGAMSGMMDGMQQGAEGAMDKAADAMQKAMQESMNKN